MKIPKDTLDARDHYRGDVAEHYDAARAGDRKWAREQRIVESFLATVPNGSRILDIPVGTGRFFSYYEGVASEVCGVDISEDMLKQAARKIPQGSAKFSLAVGDAEALTFSDKTFDYIVCARLLNLVPLDALKRMLLQFARVTRRAAFVEVRLRGEVPMNTLFRIACRRPVTTGRLMLSRLVRARRRPAIAGGAATYHHDASDFHRAVEESGFAVNFREVVDESDYAPFSVRNPLYFYSLVPAARSAAR